MDIGIVSFVVFVVAMVLTLYLKRSRIEFQGIIAISRTKKLRRTIYNIGKSHSSFWRSYFNVGIAIGLIVMVLGTIYMLVLTAQLFSGSGTPAFGLVIPYPTSEISYSSGFLMVPPWLWILAIPFLLIPHELSHGLALAANKLRIKSLGLLALLLIVPGAFVEPDEKQLKKASRLQKLQVYCAGSFSNIITALIFILLTYIFLAAFYSPAGIDYKLPGDYVNRSDITGNMTLPNGMVALTAANSTYIASQYMLDRQANLTTLALYEDFPAARNNLSGAIEKIGSFEVNSADDVSKALSAYKPGDSVTVQTSRGMYNITLADRNESAYLGIATSQPNILVEILAPANARPYQAKYAAFEPLGNFILLEITFIVAVCVGVAIFNMLPMKPLDGGLAIEVLTGSKIANIFSVGILLILIVNFAAAIGPALYSLLMSFAAAIV